MERTLHLQDSSAENIETTYGIPQPASVLLDVVRFGAALAVLMMHCSEFGTGWPNRERWGDIAVPVFFVLSGFVIRLVTRTKPIDPIGYAIDRASRMYSVVVPAIMLTLMCSGLCWALDTDRFLQSRNSFGHPLKAILANLTFVSQIWSHNAVPEVNIPFWSLGYECPYYVLYGALFFLTGWKRILAAIIWAAFVGPQILFLLPLWWLGVWVCDSYQVLRRHKPLPICSTIVLALWLAASSLPAWGRTFSIQSIFQRIGALPNPLNLAGFFELRATMTAHAAGIVSGTLLLLSLLALDSIPWMIPAWLQTGVRRVADGTFVLYLFHYPLLYLCSYSKLLRPGYEFQNIASISGIVLLCVASAGPMDELKKHMRSWLKNKTRAGAGELETVGI